MTNTVNKYFIKELYNRMFDFNTVIYHKHDPPDLSLKNIRKQLFDENTYIKSEIRNIVDTNLKNCLYIIKDNFEINYLIFVFDDDEFLIGGPFLTENQGKFENIRNILKKNNVKIENLKELRRYYMELPVVNVNKTLSVLDILIKFHHLEEMKVKFVNGSLREMEKSQHSQEELRDKMAYYKEIYTIENQMMEAVSLGNEKKAAYLFTQLDSSRLGLIQRDFLEYHKSFYTILNTLLRKAIESVGVHPYYLNEISRNFAEVIVSQNNIDDFENLALDMIKEYCKYATKYTMNQCSPNIKKAMDYININIHYDYNPETMKFNKPTNVLCCN
ncbi:MAG TPA: hypothetical protein GX530_06715 [Corynebacteriales bacterium]|nr:hypothetical protein [Mycobacteriales bacterium]